MLKAKDVAKLMNVHEDTVRSWLRNGTGPAAFKTKTGRVFFHEQDVQDWLAKQERIRTAAPPQAPGE